MSTKTEYGKFRNAGYSPDHALRAAKILLQWEELGDRVRISAEPEMENYFDVYGEPDGYTDIFGKWHSPEQERKEIEESIDRLGCWYVFSEYFDGEEWQRSDGVGMCSGYRNPVCPFQNCYVPDLMEAAIDALENLALAPNL